MKSNSYQKKVGRGGLIIRFFVSLLAFFCLVCCNKLDADSEFVSAEQKSVNKARDYYDSFVKTKAKLKGLDYNGFMPVNFSEDWASALVSKAADRDAECVEVPIKDDGRVVVAVGGKKVDVLYRLVMLNDSEFEKPQLYVKMLVAERGYKMESGKLKHFGDLEDFSGYMVVATLEGELFTVVHYVDGAQVSYVYGSLMSASAQDKFREVAGGILRNVNFYLVPSKHQTKASSGGCVCGQPCGLSNGIGNCENSIWIGSAAVSGTPTNKWAYNSGLTIIYYYTTTHGLFERIYWIDSEPDAGGGGGGNPGNPWPTNIHNQIIENALGSRLSFEQLEKVKKGSYDADQLQGIEYNHIHAQRSSSQNVRDALVNTRNYFAQEAYKFVITGDYEALGRALHPIMDAYAPPHQGFSVYDGFKYMLLHYPELLLTVNNFGNFMDSMNAVESVLNLINNLPDIPVPTINDLIDICIIWENGYAQDYL